MAINIIARVEHGDALTGALILHELLLERILPTLLARPLLLATVVVVGSATLVLLHRGAELLDPPPPPPFDSLPWPRWRLIGRDDDLSWLTMHLLEHASRIALWGIPGVEYTALAHAAAAQARDRKAFPGGIVTLDCSKAQSAARILANVIGRFNPSGRPFTGDDLEYARNVCQRQLKRRLKGKSALVILRTMAGAIDLTDVVEPLTAAGLSVLLTLDRCPSPDIVPSDCAREIPSMRLADAVRLFEHTYAEHSTLALTVANRGVVTEIVRLLGLRPRRIYETALAAAQQHRDLLQLRDELLPQQAAAFEDWNTDMPDERHILTSTDPSLSSLSGTIPSLPVAARELAIVLAAFATEEVGRRAFLAVAREITEDPSRPLKFLIEGGIVHAHTDRALPASADRERLILSRSLQPLLLKAFRSQSWSKTRTRVYLALAHYYAGYARGQPDVVLERDLDNMLGVLDAAFEHADDPAWSAAITRLTVGLRRYWLSNCPVALAVSYLHQAMSAADAGQSRKPSDAQVDIAAEVFALAAAVFERAGEWEQARDACTRGITLRARASGDVPAGQCYLQLARASLGQARDAGDVAALRTALHDAAAAVIEAVKIARLTHDVALAAEALSVQALIFMQSGARHEAYAKCVEAWTWMWSIAEEGAAAWRTRGEVLAACSQLCLAQHNVSYALGFADDAVEAFREAGDDVRLAQAYCRYGTTLAIRGSDAEARAALDAARQLASDIGAKHIVGQAAGMLALVAWEQHLRRSHGNRRARPLHVLAICGEAAPAARAGLAAQRDGRLHAAEEHYRRALKPLAAARDRRGQELVASNLSLVQEAQRFTERGSRLAETTHRRGDGTPA